MPFCLQERSDQQNTSMLMYAIQFCQQLHLLETRMAHQQVSFMNALDVMEVVTVLVNFQIQSVLDL